MTIHLLYVIKRTCIRIRPPLPHLQISFFNSLSASSFAIHPMYGILYLDQGLSTWLKAVQQVPVMWRFAWSISKTPLQNKLLRWEFLKFWSSLILASKQLSNWKQNCCCSHFFFCIFTLCPGTKIQNNTWISIPNYIYEGFFIAYRIPTKVNYIV